MLRLPHRSALVAQCLQEPNAVAFDCSVEPTAASRKSNPCLDHSRIASQLGRLNGQLPDDRERPMSISRWPRTTSQAGIDSGSTLAGDSRHPCHSQKLSIVTKRVNRHESVAVKSNVLSNNRVADNLTSE